LVICIGSIAQNAQEGHFAKLQITSILPTGRQANIKQITKFKNRKIDFSDVFGNWNLGLVCLLAEASA
jgi:hypothetical protein